MPDDRELVQRLSELRRRLLLTALFLVVAMAAVYAVSGRALEHLLGRHPDLGGLVFLHPSEAFFARLKLSFAGAVVATFPVALGQGLAFLQPVLGRFPRRALFLLIPLTSLLFLAGAAFGYWALVPAALRFLLGFGSPEVEPLLAVGPYVSFTLMLTLPLGLLFQLPLLMAFLARAGILDPRALGEHRGYAVLLAFIAGAILTPADVVSQVLLAVPLWLIFEVGLLAGRLATRGRRSGSGR